MAERAPTAGFGLIEALVALAVLGVVLGGALAAGGGSLAVADRGRRELAMAVLAETLLERAGLDLLLDSAVADGADGRLRWRLERTPAAPPDDRAARDGTRRAALWRVEARVEDGSSGLVLATLLLMESR